MNNLAHRPAIFGTISGVFFSIFVFMLMVLASLLAHAQEAAPDLPPPEALPDLAGPAGSGIASLIAGKIDPLANLIASGTIASILIIAALLWARKAFPSRLAPEPSTETSRLWNLGLAMGLGLVLGLIGVAPGLPIGGSTLGPDATAMIGRVLGGFIAATVAVFGRDFFTRSRGMLDEKREAKAASLAGMTTGQLRIERAKDEAEEQQTPPPTPPAAA